jgi:N-acetylmuramoyl-L-alanine amidase
VTVSSLNVRARPSKKSTVQTVVVQGTSVTVLGRSNGWIKVALADGTIGWVVAIGIGGNGSTGNSVNQPVAPARQGQLAPTSVREPTIKARVSGLRVHSSPSLGANVVTSVVRGQKMTVIARSGGWVEVRLPNGTTGWVSSAYATGNRAVAAKKTYTGSTTTARTTSTGGPRATAAMNVRTSPSLKATVATVLLPGASYRVLGWSNGWAHVRLANGTVGWVSGAVLGVASTGTAANTYANTHPRPKTTVTSVGGSVITAGVRVHSSPGIKAPVVTLAARGTHVRVLGYSRGWTLVRLPNGRTGYVLGIYVR